MMEEPVVKASDNLTKPKAGVDHCTSSPASRDRLVAAMVAAARYSSAKSRAEIASMELRIGRAKPSAMRGDVAVDGKGRAGQRRGAQRRFIHPLPGVLETAAVAREHLDIGQQMMAEGHRLGRLHMGEARHDGVDMLLGLREQRALQRQQALIGAFAGGAHPKPEIRHHLVVARARGVQPPGRRADDLGQPRLDVQMNVFQFALEDEVAVGDFLFDLVQALEDGLGVILGDDAFGGQHAHMRPRAGQVFARQPLVEIDGGGNLPHDRGGAGFEPPAPHFVRRHAFTRGPMPEPQPAQTAVIAAFWLWAFYMGLACGPVHAAPCHARAAGGAETRQSRRRAVDPSPMRRAARHALADFKGHYVLLNLWATWCAPCVAELPALAKLKAAVPGLKVLAVDVGQDKADAAAAFLKSHNAAQLGTYVDTDMALMHAFGAYGLPTTVLIDPKGKEIATAPKAPANGRRRDRSLISRISS